MLTNKRMNSPVKQNISPDAHSFSPQKQTNSIKQLIQTLKQLNIPIPQQLIEKTLTNQKNNCQIKLNQVPCEDLTQLKTLKVQLSDTKFELKKLQEDFAEYKVLARMEKQKIIKKYLSEIEVLKKKLQEDNNNWQKRYKETCQQFNSQKKTFQKKVSTESEQQLISEIKIVQNKYHKKIDELQTRVKTLSVRMQERQQIYLAQKQSIIAEFEQNSKLQIENLKTVSSEKQRQITQKLQNKIEVIQLEKKLDLKNFEESLQKLQTQIKKLQDDCYFLQKEKEDLNSQLKTKERKINQLQIAIIAKQEDLIQNKTQFQSQKKQLNQSFDLKIKRIKQNHLKEITQIKTQFITEIDAYYHRINNLQQRKIALENQYRDQMKILQQKFSERNSKNQDLEEIQRLNTILILKQRQISRYQDQLKSVELMRINDERNYTKIFHSSRRKSSKSHKDKQSIFKQSNTTDLKVLLKICNKQF